jgi:hypothetical protein
MEKRLAPRDEDQNELVSCQNCEQLFEEGSKFCPHCGQKTADDLTIGVLFYNTISNYFSFDARFLKSFFPLMFRPGYLAVQFIGGKRLLYLHPAQMYLFVSVIFFFLLSFNTRDIVTKADEINQKVTESSTIDELSKETQTIIDSIVAESSSIKTKQDLSKEERARIDSLVKSRVPVGVSEFVSVEMDEELPDTLDMNNNRDLNTSWDFDRKKVDSLLKAGADDETIYKSMGMSEDAGFLKRRLFKSMLNLYKGRGAGSIVQAFFDSIPLAMFFLLPIFALILKIFYFNKGKYAHHLVFSFYFFSFLFTVFSIDFAINRFLYDIPDWIDWLIALSTFVYFLLSLIVFYGQNWFLTIIKSGIISFVFLLMIIPMALVILIAFSFLFY